jgi:hypothetical protein
LGSRIQKTTPKNKLISSAREEFLSKPSIDSLTRINRNFTRKNSILKNNNSKLKRESNPNKKRINFEDIPQTETIEIKSKKSIEIDDMNIPQNQSNSPDPSKQNTEDFFLNYRL